MAPTLRRSRIGVLMGGRSAEREVSLQSGQAVLEALLERGWHAVPIDVSDRPCRQIEDAGIDVAFVALHGRFGEDGCIQGLLESMGTPYTGSGVLGSAVAMDKVLTKRLLDSAQIPTPRWAFPASVEAAKTLGFPLVAKPRGEGSSVGVKIIHDDNMLAETLARPVEQPIASQLLLEAYVEGRELSAGVMGYGAQARVLGDVEIRAVSGHYDYEAKYQRDDTDYLVPAPVPATVTTRLATNALATHRLLECSGAARVDFRWSGRIEDEPLVLEINTLPGMTSHSLLPKIAAKAGMSYGELVEQIVTDAGLRA